ncbi:hypothetical protein SBA6_140005 [Candidatus Sulfopaludibacter sp. SbA6]|nr:hypothetical protein SBA6_140005 [Candidatus Sulfopaludibacter sp. SbA6]
MFSDSVLPGPLAGRLGRRFRPPAVRHARTPKTIAAFPTRIFIVPDLASLGIPELLIPPDPTPGHEFVVADRALHRDRSGPCD